MFSSFHNQCSSTNLVSYFSCRSKRCICMRYCTVYAALGQHDWLHNHSCNEHDVCIFSFSLSMRTFCIMNPILSLPLCMHRAVERSNCFHHKGPNAKCGASGNLYMIIFGLVEILLSQFPNLEKITVLSVVAAAMSFTYSFIALALCIAKFASHGSIKGTLLGVKITGDVSASTKVWQSLQALGNIAFAYTYSMLLIEIQVYLKSQINIHSVLQFFKYITDYDFNIYIS